MSVSVTGLSSDGRAFSRWLNVHWAKGELPSLLGSSFDTPSYSHPRCRLLPTGGTHLFEKNCFVKLKLHCVRFKLLNFLVYIYIYILVFEAMSRAGEVRVQGIEKSLQHDKEKLSFVYLNLNL